MGISTAVDEFERSTFAANPPLARVFESMATSGGKQMGASLQRDHLDGGV